MFTLLKKAVGHCSRANSVVKEEVLGLKWEDMNLDTMTLYVRRAVTHPTRNQPEIKATKTEASVRAIGLSSIAARFLVPGDENEFVFGGLTP